MKIALVLACFGLGIIGLVTGTPVHSAAVADLELQVLETSDAIAVKSSLKELFDRFLILIDKVELAKFIIDKLTNDPEAMDIFRYLKGDKAKAIASHIINDPEYIRLIRWFYDNGLTDIYNNINHLHSFFGWETIPMKERKGEVLVNGAFARSLQTLLEELMDVLPLNAMAALAMELYEEGDEAAILLIQRFREDGMAEAWGRLKALPEAIELGEAITEGGVALEMIILLIEVFFGWS